MQGAHERWGGAKLKERSALAADARGGDAVLRRANGEIVATSVARSAFLRELNDLQTPSQRIATSQQKRFGRLGPAKPRGGPWAPEGLGDGVGAWLRLSRLLTIGEVAAYPRATRISYIAGFTREILRYRVGSARLIAWLGPKLRRCRTGRKSGVTYATSEAINRARSTR